MKLTWTTIFDESTGTQKDEYGTYIALRAIRCQEDRYERIGLLGPAGNRSNFFDDGSVFENIATLRILTIQ